MSFVFNHYPVIIVHRCITETFERSILFEAYCFHENKWTQLSDMLKSRCEYSTVSIGNKMFVIDRVDTNYIEVFDSLTNKFTIIKSYPNI